MPIGQNMCCLALRPLSQRFGLQERWHNVFETNKGPRNRVLQLVRIISLCELHGCIFLHSSLILEYYSGICCEVFPLFNILLVALTAKSYPLSNALIQILCQSKRTCVGFESCLILGYSRRLSWLTREMLPCRILASAFLCVLNFSESFAIVAIFC